MNTFYKPECFESPQSKLLYELSNHAGFACAVEYAFQRGDISAGEYRTWQNRIIEIERQRTSALLGLVRA